MALMLERGIQRGAGGSLLPRVSSSGTGSVGALPISNWPFLSLPAWLPMKCLYRLSEGFFCALIGVWQARGAMDFTPLPAILTNSTTGLGRWTPQPSTWDKITLYLTVPIAHVES